LLSYPATITSSARTLNHLAGLIRRHRGRRRSRWRRLDPGRQALLVLAQLRNRDTDTRPAAGFAIAVATARAPSAKPSSRSPRPPTTRTRP
jgi:hypothetical protein